MPDGYYLTPDDYRTLKQMMDQFRKSGTLVNQQSRGVHTDPDDAIQSPEVYIALPQEDTGIPALQRAVGTADEDLDIPGVAQCDIYQIVTDSVGTAGEPQLVSIGKSEPVYNLNDYPLPCDWMVIQRTKFGHWVGPVFGLKLVKSDQNVGGVGNFKQYDMSTQQPLDPERTMSVNVLLGAYIADNWAYVIGGEMINTQCDPCDVGTGS